MSDISAATTASLNSWVQLADNNPTDFSTNLDNLLEEFSIEEVGNGVTQSALKEIVGKLRDLINDSNDLPASIVDAANAQLDSFLSDLEQTCPCSAEVSDAISNTDQASQISDIAEQLVEAVTEQLNETTTGSSPTTLSPEAQTEAEAEAANEGTDTSTTLSPEAQTEAEAEAANEGTVTSSSNDEGTNTGESANAGLEEDGEREGNWLLVLAKTLADVQSKFLDAAMANSKTMSDESGNVVAGSEDSTGSEGDSKSAAFLQAQGEFTANMQLFNLFANQASTALKTLGEGVSAIARKT